MNIVVIMDIYHHLKFERDTIPNQNVRDSSSLTTQMSNYLSRKWERPRSMKKLDNNRLSNSSPNHYMIEKLFAEEVRAAEIYEKLDNNRLSNPSQNHYMIEKKIWMPKKKTFTIKQKVSRLRLYKIRVLKYCVKKIKHYLRHLNNENENKVLSYCEALRYM